MLSLTVDGVTRSEQFNSKFGSVTLNIGDYAPEKPVSPDDEWNLAESDDESDEEENEEENKKQNSDQEEDDSDSEGDSDDSDSDEN